MTIRSIIRNTISASLIEESSVPLKSGYIGQCDSIRRKYDDGEEFWQFVMSHKEIITQKEFEQHVDVLDIPLLDEDENWKTYARNFFREWEDGYFGKSKISGKDIYFLATGGTNGFEWFWCE